PTILLPHVAPTRRSSDLDPDDLAEGAELVEHAGLEVGEAGGQDGALEIGEGQRQPLDLLDGLAQAPARVVRRRILAGRSPARRRDRKSRRLNSSHQITSY